MHINYGKPRQKNDQPFRTVCELSKNGIKAYGGNYDFYTEQKQIENNALSQDIQSKEKALRKAKEKERETLNDNKN